ncbi:MAG: tRNA 2-thiouridine(34) synthase MnmA [Actinomycetes bacterium]
MKVLAAMSGGVDSAVAAARAVDAGHDVTGVHLALSPKPAALREGARGCCTLEDARDARRAADTIGIPFYVWDLAQRFQRDVVDDFVAEYAVGRTPNPCLRCNEHIKFTAVLDRALALGFDAVCTGHHARLVDGRLHRSVDPAKDQSYVLGVLTEGQLSNAMFPLGDSTKQQVRTEARQRGLLVADKPDSHDICFIPSGDTAGFLTERLGAAPGSIVDAETTSVVGGHDGTHGFTIGQRKGLRIGHPAADGKPRYVLALEPTTGTVTVGPAEALDVAVITGTRARWCGPEPESPFACSAQVRAHGKAVPATAYLTSNELTVVLDVPVRGVAPGQAVVLYDGARVLGSATIDQTSMASAERRRVSSSVFGD